MPRITALPLFVAAVSVSAPAHADHPVAGGSVSGSGPIVTTSAETPAPGSLAAGIQATLTRPDSYDDAELIAFAAQHVEAHTTDFNLRFNASLAYGLSDHLAVSANLPLIRRDDLRGGRHGHASGASTNGVEDLGTVSGLGDLSLMAQYVLADRHEQGWALAILAGLKLPTGSTTEAADDGERLETEHQPGTGSWDPLLGLAAQKRWGATSLHGSVLYQVSSRGSQDTRLGDRLNLNAALVFDLSREPEHEEPEHQDHGGLALVLETNYEREGPQEIAGTVDDESGGEILWLSPGLRFAPAAGWSAGLSAGVPVWQRIGVSHPENAFRLIVQLGTGF